MGLYSGSSPSSKSKNPGEVTIHHQRDTHTPNWLTRKSQPGVCVMETPEHANSILDAESVKASKSSAVYIRWRMILRAGPQPSLSGQLLSWHQCTLRSFYFHCPRRNFSALRGYSKGRSPKVALGGGRNVCPSSHGVEKATSAHGLSRRRAQTQCCPNGLQRITVSEN